MVAQILKFFDCQWRCLSKNQKTKKNRSFILSCVGPYSHTYLLNFQSLNHKQQSRIGWDMAKNIFICNLNVCPFCFLPYLSQVLTKLLEMLISLQRIKISIHGCNACEVILVFFWYNKRPVTTGPDQFSLCCGLIRTSLKGPVVVPVYLNQFRLVVVASCLILEKKTGLNWTQKH